MNIAINFAGGLVCNSQGSIGDPLIAPCRRYHGFFARKLKESSGCASVFWEGVEKIASIAYLVLGPLALIGGTANLLFIPLVALYHFTVVKSDLAKIETEAKKQPCDAAKVETIEKCLANARRTLLQVTLKGQMVQEVRVTPGSNKHCFSVGFWNAFRLTDLVYVTEEGQQSSLPLSYWGLAPFEQKI